MYHVIKSRCPNYRIIDFLYFQAKEIRCKAKSYMILLTHKAFSQCQQKDLVFDMPVCNMWKWIGIFKHIQLFSLKMPLFHTKWIVFCLFRPRFVKENLFFLHGALPGAPTTHLPPGSQHPEQRPHGVPSRQGLRPAAPRSRHERRYIYFHNYTTLTPKGCILHYVLFVGSVSICGCWFAVKSVIMLQNLHA